MRKAREKLSVARVAREMPRTRREKHWVSRRWWGWKGWWCEMMVARRRGRKRVERVKIWKVEERAWWGAVI